MILSCQNISKSFGSDDILKDISFQVNEGDKLAIVGSNGAGKSTLLKIITGELEADQGTVVFAKGTTVGYLAQYQGAETDGTIYEIVRSSCEEIIRMEQELHDMEEEMKRIGDQELEQLLQRYHQLNDKFNHLGGNSYESEVNGVLRGLGFSEDDFAKTMDMLSGGQKTRVSLGKLLVTKPDILLLDEPINHLDLSSIQWLENYLLNYKGTVVIVAHDRFFLDRIVSGVLDISNHKAHMYKGNYTAFAKQKEQFLLTRLREYEKQQEMIAHQQEVIDKLKQFNREKSIKRAESRQKALDKVELIEKPVEDNQNMRLHLEPDTVSGNDVLELIHVSKAYDGVALFTDVNLLLTRGEHVAIIGDNGTGKTTLLKIITQRKDADGGVIRLGSHVTIGYYDQEQQVLDDDKTLFEEMSDAYPNLNQTKIRNVLAAFMFMGDDCYKKIGDLSGGERGRISLAKLMLSGANFLILDEPTNHLDMESKEILENALNHYSGTLLYVSHDRYFINKTAHRVLELNGQQFENYLGNYDYYIEKKYTSKEIESLSEAVGENQAKDDSQGKMDWQQQKKLQSEKRKIENQLQKVEQEIGKIEGKLAELDARLEDPAVATNSAKLNEITGEQQGLKEQLEDLYLQWETLSENELLNF
ncbi:MAG: ABC-F family ATP-binding cassette domain-containing protein [Lachnospiraceae bacterium]|nr:ABC-F family ATP-binding cassette domain-containing protein [Lachnospiraceae bacterium]